MSFKRSRLLVFLALGAALFSTMVLPSEAAFTVAPTLDLTTSSHIAGATDAVYAFHAENPDVVETVVSFSVPVPAGYLINPMYLTTTSGIVVLTGVYGFIGQPISGYLKLETTGISGQFAIYAKRISPPTIPEYVPIGVATVTPPTQTIPGVWSVTLGAPNNGEYIDLIFIAGFFINPTTPGVYTWGPSTATASDFSVVAMDPRSGFTNQVWIGLPVGGFVTPVNKLAVIAPYLALISLVGGVTIVATIRRRKP